jgi:hypothetical protein
MNRYDDLALSGSPDLEALRRTDELLDRLGRREPGPRDLDDPVAAALAVLAGDVDLSPVPVLDTRQALTSAGLWPLPTAWEQGPDVDASRSGSADGAPRPTDVGIAAQRSTPDDESTWADTRREQLRRPRSRSQSRTSSRPRRSVVRMRPELDHPRVLRIRPAAGIAVAAALVLLGGGVSAAVTSDTVNPLTGIAAVFGHWPDGRTDAQRQARVQLTAKVKQAQEAARLGNALEAYKIIAEVQGQIQNLSGDDRKKLQEQLTEVQGSLPASTDGAIGFTDLTGADTSEGDAGGSQNPAAASVSSGSSTHSSHYTHGRSRSSASGPTAGSSAPHVGENSGGGGSLSGSGSSAGGSTATRPDRPTWSGSTHHTRGSNSDSTPPTHTRESSASDPGTTETSTTTSSTDASVLSADPSQSRPGSDGAAVTTSSSS